MVRFFLLMCFVMLPTLGMAIEVDREALKDYTTALVIYNRTTGETFNSDRSLSSRRLAPCSTFKIYNTLIGLQLGLIEDPKVPWYKWDGIKRDIEGWNQNLTLQEAFKVSSVPAFQILARQIGKDRMHQYIKVLGYGTMDISAGVDVFWLDNSQNTSIKINADEQVGLLNKLLDGQLPFSSKAVNILKDVMKLEETSAGTLYGKTGTGAGKEPLGWFVGFVEHKGSVYVFACNITHGKNPSGKSARAIVEKVFRANGLL